MTILLVVVLCLFGGGSASLFRRNTSDENKNSPFLWFMAQQLNRLETKQNEIWKLVQDHEKKLKTVKIQRSCGVGWHYFRGHCYFFSVDRKSWSDAQSTCVVKGSSLVTVNNNKENSWLKAKVTQYTWIGAHDSRVEGQWRWVSDNSIVSFTDWEPSEPNNHDGGEDCAHLRFDGSFKWNDSDCGNAFAYICERSSNE